MEKILSLGLTGKKLLAQGFLFVLLGLILMVTGTWLLHENAPKVEKPGVIADLHDKIRDKMGFAHLED